MNRALVLMSGGIDSAVALAWAQKNHDSLVAISFLYHLRPFRERLSVQRLLQKYPARLLEVPVPFLRESVDLADPLPEVPEGYISNRNLIFYSIAGYAAEVHRCDAIVGGHNCGDSEDFPDAAASFFSQLESLTNKALLTRKVRIELPLAKWNKKQVLEHAALWGVPLEHTWSCYWDATVPCGTCASCLERAGAFAQLGIADPLLRP
jgi:7-cyano-7-deazaguanine synthase